MNHRTSKRSALFLMELLIAILFFSLASAICIQLFVKSYTLSQQTAELNVAITEVESMEESLVATQFDMEKVQEFFPDSEQQEQVLSVYYNKDYGFCKPKDAVYQMKVQIEKEAKMYQVNITFLKGNVTIYELHTEHYVAKE